MSSLKLQRSLLKRRQKTIACPRCRTRQPLAHTCSHCGFDIKAYVLNVKGIRGRASKQKQNVKLTEPVPAPPAKITPVTHSSQETETSVSPPLSAPQKHESKTGRKSRIIACPECKARQSLAHTCSHCGFDIKAYVLDVKGIRPRTQKPDPDNEGHSAVHVPQSDATPAQPPEHPRQKPVEQVTRKKRDLACPDCHARQPFAYVCHACGFDFRAYALKRRQKAVTASLQKSGQLISSVSVPPISPRIPFSPAAPEAEPVMARHSAPSGEAEQSSGLTPLQDLEAYLEKYIEELMTPLVEAVQETSVDTGQTPALEAQPLHEVEVEAPQAIYIEADDRPGTVHELDPELADVVAGLVASASKADQFDIPGNEAIPYLEAEEQVNEPEAKPAFVMEGETQTSLTDEPAQVSAPEIAPELLDVVAGLAALAAESDRFDLHEDGLPDIENGKQVNEPEVEPAFAMESDTQASLTDEPAPGGISEKEPAMAMEAVEVLPELPGTSPAMASELTPSIKKQCKESFPAPAKTGRTLKPERKPVRVMREKVSVAPAPALKSKTRTASANRTVSASWTATRTRASQARAFLRASWTKVSAFTSRTVLASWTATRTRALQAGAFLRASWAKAGAFTSRAASASWAATRTRALQAKAFITEKTSEIQARRIARKQLPPPALYPERQEPGPGEAIPMVALAHRAWQDFRKRAGIFMGIWGLGLALYSAPVLATLWAMPYLGRHGGIMLALTAAAGAIGFCRILCLLFAATVDRNATFLVARYRGTRLMVPAVLACALVLCLASWGLIFLIVPAIWIMAAGFTTLPVIYVEKESWIKAVIKSFDYTDGHIGLVIARLLPLLALMAGAPALMWRLASPQMGIAGLVISGLMVPYALTYLYLLFENIRDIHGRIVLFKVSRRVRVRWMFTGLAGAAASVAVMLEIYRLIISGRALEYLASLI